MNWVDDWHRKCHGRNCGGNTIKHFWRHEGSSSVVTILIGEDDECRDVGFMISFSDFDRMMTALAEKRIEQ
ncbi:hypothetical protein [Bacteroides cellulosilyticus]|uniref:hypothetical protein n=1 Tax=Bacteroides cellulosilyticus TaxID=246787 RepID=UPI0032EE3C3F